MATVVQHTFNESTATGQTTVAKAFVSGVTTGSLLVATVGWYDDHFQHATVSDPVNGAWTAATAQVNDLSSTEVSQQIFYFANAGSGATTVTATYSGAIDFPWIHITEVSGIATASVIDTTASNNGPSGTPSSTGSMITSNAADFLYCGGSTNNTWTSAGTGFTLLDATPIDGNAAEYQIVSSTGSYTGAFGPTQTSGWVIQMVAFKIASGTTTSGTCAISARASVTVLPRVLKDAIVTFSAGAAITCRADLGRFAQLIVIGRATGAFTSRLLYNMKVVINGRATLSPVPKLTHSATVSIAGRANVRPSGFIAPVYVSATVHIFAFCASNVVIAPIFGRAVARFNAQIPQALITINGRATLTPVARVTRNSTLGISAKAAGKFTGLVTGPGPLYSTLLVVGKATLTARSRVLNNATVFIFAGNQTPIPPVNATVAIAGHASLTLTAFNTHKGTVSIAGRATTIASAIVTGGAVVYNSAAVQIKGTASLRAAIPTIPVYGTVSLKGKATCLFTSTSILHENGVVNILGSAAASNYYATVYGAYFLNSVVRLGGRATLVPLATLQDYPTLRIVGRASGFFYGGVIKRPTVSIKGFASLRVSTPRQSLVWSSAHTLQYKVWQYRLESMTRVLGTTFTVTSVGMSFQSVAMEVTMTDAGWGN